MAMVIVASCPRPGYGFLVLSVLAVVVVVVSRPDEWSLRTKPGGITLFFTKGQRHSKSVVNSGQKDGPDNAIFHSWFPLPGV